MNTQIKLFLTFILLCNLSVKAQFKYESNGYITIGSEQYTPIIIQNKWGMEYWEGGLNFWIPWPDPDNGNYKLFLKDNGNIGIGKDPSYKLDVAGDIATSGVLRTSSDIRLKSNIQNITGCLDKLMLLNGKSYNKKIILTTNKSISYDSKDSIKLKTIQTDLSRSEKVSKTQFGFIAQDLKDIFPELVSKDESGYLSIDYIGLIPIIIEAIKEQKENIDKQENEIIELEKLIKEFTNSKNYKSTLEISNTSIKYNIANSYSSAQINIYDKNGLLIKNFSLPKNQQEGEINFQINQSSPNEIYLYNLICDGKNIISKKIIL